MAKHSSLTASERLLVAAGCVWMTLIGISVTMMGPLGSVLAEWQRRPVTDGPQVTGAFFWGSAAVIVFASLFPKRFASVLTVRLSGLAMMLGGMGIMFSQSWTAVLASSVVLGAANGGISVWFNAEVAHRFGERSGRWLALVNAFWPVGAVLGPRIVSSLYEVPTHPHLLLTALALAGLPLAFLVPHDPHVVAASEGAEPSPAKGPSLGTLGFHVWALAAVLGLYVGTEILTMMLMTRYLEQAQGLPFADASSANSVLWFAFMASRFASAWLATRISPGMFVVMGGFLAAVAGLTVGLGGSAVAIAGFALMGVAMGPIFPAVMAWGTRGSDQPQRATSVMVLGASVAALALPPVALAWINVDVRTFPPTLAGFYGLLGAAAVGVLVIQRRRVARLAIPTQNP